jgi:lipoate-protein ligase A
LSAGHVVVPGKPSNLVAILREPLNSKADDMDDRQAPPESEASNPLPLEKLQLWHDCTPRCAALNMAMDEVLTLTVQVPLLRLYQWETPAVSFGYFQPWREVEPVLNGRNAVRRWTGGGLVEHGEDLTYSLILPRAALHAAGWDSASPWLYARLHRLLKEAIERCGSETLVMAEEGLAAGAGVCFAAPVVADLLSGKGKVAGAAQRRTRSAVLHQGSIQAAVDRSGLAETFASLLASRVTEFRPAGTLVPESEQLAARKYAQTEWLRRVE